MERNDATRRSRRGSSNLEAPSRHLWVRARTIGRLWFDRLLADRCYDSNAIRAAIAAQGAEVVIPPTRSRKTAIPYDRQAYRARNLVERLWCRLKDWRRIATRYDKLAANCMAGVFLAAIITFWCN